MIFCGNGDSLHGKTGPVTEISKWQASVAFRIPIQDRIRFIILKTENE